MKDTPPPVPLPDDPAALKALIARMQSRMDALELRSLRLEVELLKYKKWLYGPRADRLKSLGEVAQMLLGFGEELDRRPVDPSDAADLAAEDEGAPSTPSRRVKRARGRRNLASDAFAHLPVTRCEHDLPEGEKPCPCCGRLRERIGEDVSWQLEYIPGHFERLEHVRFKYACAACERNGDGPRIERADAPSGAIEKGLAGPGLLAFIVTSKFADYLPLYRLEGIFARSGVEIARSTQSLWCRDVADLVRPLYDLMVRRVLASRVIGTDDTVMPMQAPGKTRKARMWAYVGDEENPTPSSTSPWAARATGRSSSSRGSRARCWPTPTGATTGSWSATTWCAPAAGRTRGGSSSTPRRRTRRSRPRRRRSSRSSTPSRSGARGWTMPRGASSAAPNRRRCWVSSKRSCTPGATGCSPSTPWPWRSPTRSTSGRRWSRSRRTAPCPSTTTPANAR